MNKKVDFRAEVREMAGRAKKASYQLAQLSSAVKDKALLEMAKNRVVSLQSVEGADDIAIRPYSTTVVAA